MSFLKINILILGISNFYSALMQAVGASSKVWEIIDREPEIPMDGKFMSDK